MVEISVDGVRVQFVRRGRTWYIRKKPFTSYVPSRRQAYMRALYLRVAEMARRMSDEEVARLVGGIVVGRNKIMMPDGRILPKLAALVTHYLRGVEPPLRGGNGALLRPPAWRRALSPVDARRLEELLRRLSTAVEVIERAAAGHQA